jgi:ribosomal protein S18 acetylase RimI-like enzyme
MMQVVAFEAAHVADVTRLVNAQIAAVAPGWQLSEARVWDILQKESLWEIHYADEDPPPWTWSVETVCVVEGERVLAAARFDYRYDEGVLGMVSGRWLVAEVNQAEAVGMLLAYLIAKRGDSQAAILVNGRSDFGAGWSGVPTSDEQIRQVLEEKGFVPFQKWVIMTAEIGNSEPPPQSYGGYLASSSVRRQPASEGGNQTLRWEIDEGRLEWDVAIYDGDTMIGECQSWGIPPEFETCAGYEEWMQIEWLGVEEAYQRRGLGRRLLEAQLRYHAARGVKHCLLYTEVNNVAARAVNVALGFEVQAEVWGWMWKGE